MFIATKKSGWSLKLDFLLRNCAAIVTTDTSSVTVIGSARRNSNFAIRCIARSIDTALE
jgi:hypothetical protein